MCPYGHVSFHQRAALKGAATTRGLNARGLRWTTSVCAALQTGARSSRARLPKLLPMKQQRISHVLRQVTPTVVPGPQSELMTESLLRQDLVQKLGTFFEAVAVVVAAIEVQLQVGEVFGVLCKRQRAIGFPIGLVERRAERPLEYTGVESPTAFRGNRVRELGQQSRTLSAGSSENVRMAHAQVQCSITAHRATADAACLPV